jgi:hypothetical protein
MEVSSNVIGGKGSGVTVSLAYTITRGATDLGESGDRRECGRSIGLSAVSLASTLGFVESSSEINGSFAADLISAAFTASIELVTKMFLATSGMFTVVQ